MRRVWFSKSPPVPPENQKWKRNVFEESARNSIMSNRRGIHEKQNTAVRFFNAGAGNGNLADGRPHGAQSIKSLVAIMLTCQKHLRIFLRYVKYTYVSFIESFSHNCLVSRLFFIEMKNNNELKNQFNINQRLGVVEFFPCRSKSFCLYQTHYSFLYYCSNSLK